MSNGFRRRFTRSLNFYLFAVGLIVLPIVTLIIFNHMSHISSVDVEAYRALLAEASLDKGASQGAHYQAKQHRVNVQKDVIYNQGIFRLHICLKAKEAQMVLDRKEESSELIEHMKDVTCAMQEEIFYQLPDGREVVMDPNGRFLLKKANPELVESLVVADPADLKPVQVIRFLEANEASYFYQSDLFKASNVAITRFIAPGHKLQDSWKEKELLMKGIADSVDFSLNGKDLNFKAMKLKATLFGKP